MQTARYATTIRMGAPTFDMRVTDRQTGETQIVDLSLADRQTRRTLGGVLCSLHGIEPGKRRRRKRRSHGKAATAAVQH